MTQLNIEIPLADGKMGGYLATPPSGKGPGVVLLQEIFGVNDSMRLAADDLAKEGYTVLVPDLFWRMEPGINLGYAGDDRTTAFGYMQKFDFPKGVGDTKAALEFLKGHDACTGKAAYLGFCLGGKLAVLGAAQGGADACVSYYGVKLQDNHAELKDLPCPFQMHVGDKDEHVPMDVVNGLQDLLADKAGADVYVYEGAAHGFYNKLRSDVFVEDYWNAATGRVLPFLKENLS